MLFRSCENRIERCKNCSPEGYQAYLDEQKRIKKRYRENNRDNLRDSQRRYRENNPDAYLDSKRKYYVNNRDNWKTKYRKKCEYECCRFSDNPSLAEFKNYYDENQRICYSAAKNQMYDITIDIHKSQKIAKHYGFKQNLVLRQEQAVLHRINSTRIGKTLREKTFGHSFDSDPIATIFEKNKIGD